MCAATLVFCWAVAKDTKDIGRNECGFEQLPNKSSKIVSNEESDKSRAQKAKNNSSVCTDKLHDKTKPMDWNVIVTSKNESLSYKAEG